MKKYATLIVNECRIYPGWCTTPSAVLQADRECDATKLHSSTGVGLIIKSPH